MKGIGYNKSRISVHKMSTGRYNIKGFTYEKRRKGANKMKSGFF